MVEAETKITPISPTLPTHSLSRRTLLRTTPSSPVPAKMAPYRATAAVGAGERGVVEGDDVGEAYGSA